MTPIQIIQKELDTYIKTLNEFEHYRSDLTNYEDDTETPISELIENADFDTPEFNIGFDQGYMRGLEVVLNLLK